MDKGISGIIVSKSDNNVAFEIRNEVGSSSSQYLKITDGTEGSETGHIFDVKLGTISGLDVSDGLATAQLVKDFVSSFATNFELIDYSLIGTDSTTQRLVENVQIPMISGMNQ